MHHKGRDSFGGRDSVSSDHLLGKPRRPSSLQSTSSYSSTGNNNGIVTSIKLRDVLMTDEELDPSFYEIYENNKNELRVTGHNLTSVLNNPRETMMDSLTDEFATAQSVPVDMSSLALDASTASVAYASLSSLASAMDPLGVFSSFSSPSHSSHTMRIQNNNGYPHLHSTYSSPSQVPHSRYGGSTRDISSHGSTAGSSMHGSSIFGGSSAHGSVSSTHGLTSASLSLTLQSQSQEFTELRALLSRTRRTLQAYQDTQEAYHQSGGGALTTLTGTGTHGQDQPSRGGLGSRDDVIQCLNLVPSAYFRPNFRLADSEIFQGSSQLKQAQGKSSTTTSAQTTVGPKVVVHTAQSAAACQDRLAAHLDRVELTLLRQIWTRSPDFFRALDDIAGLRQCVTVACRTIAELRTHLRAMDSRLALSAMRIPLLHTRHTNERRLQTLLHAVQRCREGHALVRQLLRVEDRVGALQVAAESLHLLEGELVGLQCVEGLRTDLRWVAREVGGVLIRRFVDHALDCTSSSTGSVYDMDKHSISSDTRLTHSNSEVLVPSTVARTAEGNEGSPLDATVSALLSAGLLVRALNQYRAELCDNVRLVVRTCVSEYMGSFDPLTWASNLGERLFDEQSLGGEEAPFAQRVRAMANEDFLSALALCVETLLLALNRAGVVHTAISQRPSVEVGSVVLSTQCLHASVDLAQRSLSQLLKIRRDSTSRLPLDKMRFLSELGRHFLTQLDKFSRDTDPPAASKAALSTSSTSQDDLNKSLTASAQELNKTLRAQTRAYMDHWQESHKGRLVAALDADRWVQADAGPDRQAEIDRLVSGRVFTSVRGNGSNNTDISSTTNGNSTSDPPSMRAMATSTIVADKKKEARPVTVEGVHYRVVWSCLLLVEQLIGYLDLGSSLVCLGSESIAKEVIPRMVELLRLFDVRTRLLVLGAGAIQSAARLKSISAKHLALAAQSLGLIRCLVPHLRAALLAQLNPKHHLLLTELDRLTLDYAEHHSLIAAKLVTIAGDSVDASAARLRTVDWDRFQGQCEYFDDVARNITALHRVLHEALPPTLLQDIFSRIFALVARKLLAHFEELGVMPSTQTARQRIVDEAAMLLATLGRLKQVDAGVSLTAAEEAFRKRYLAAAATPTGQQSTAIK